jgi:RNA polymerase sigma-70 factor (ECF subfamily)
MDRVDIEAAIGAALEAGDFGAAATSAVRGYGPEILGFLIGVERSESDASEIFSQFCEDLWKGLPAFRRTSSFRTWAYVIARNAASRYRRDPYKRRSRDLSELGPLSGVAEAVRDTTLTFLRSEVQDRMKALRDELAEDDRQLLVLRVDRELAWDEVARVFAGDDGPPSEELARTATALRKRFERIKKKLRERAIEEGLIARGGR